MSMLKLWKLPVVLPVMVVELTAGAAIVMIHLALAGAYDHRAARPTRPTLTS